MKKLNILILLLLVSLSAYGQEIDMQKMEDVLSQVRDLLTGTIFRIIIAIIIIYTGYLYIFGKGREGKENLFNVLIGAGIALAASGIAGMFK